MSRLPSDLLVAAMLRRANDAGGFGVVCARGDAHGGMILVVAIEQGVTTLVERGIGAQGQPVLVESGPTDAAESIDDYWRRRRARDPDLWVIELDVPQAKRLVAETILED